MNDFLIAKMKKIGNKVKIQESFWLCLVLLIYFTVAMRYINKNIGIFYGEADSYMLPTISLVENGTMVIDDTDIEKAAEDFPELYDIIKQRYDNGRMVETKDGKRNPYYFFTYSLSCIPAKLYFKLTGIPQIYAFPITNLLLVMGTCIFGFKEMKGNFIRRFFLVLSICINPIFLYLSWQSAEVFIFCALVYAILYFVNKKYKRAAFALSLAGTLNITVMFFGFIMIITFFIELCKKERTNNLLLVIRKYFWDIFKYGCSYLVVFAPFVHNWIYVNQTNSTFGMFETKDCLGRFFSYLFDLNLGIFAFMPISFVCLVISLVLAMGKRKTLCLALFVAMLGNCLMYSLALHINCGMSGVSRYGAWTTSYLIVIIAVYFPFERLKRGLVICMSAATFVSIGFIMYMSTFTNYLQLSLMSQWVLSNVPQIYNPLYSTFNCRVNGIDGAYDYMNYSPIIYRDENTCIRKVLIQGKEIKNFLNSVVADDERSLKYCIRLQEKNGFDSEKFYYLNIPKPYRIFFD